MLTFRVQCRELSAHYVVVWQIRLVYKSWCCLPYRLVRIHSLIRGGNIIDWPVILWFDSITELLFNQIGAHFSERKYCQPHRWPFFSCQVKHLTLVSLCFPLVSWSFATDYVVCRLLRDSLVCLRCLRCLTRCVVTLTEEAYSRLGFAMHRPLLGKYERWMLVSSWLHLRFVIPVISPRDITFSNGSNRSWYFSSVARK